MVYMYVKVILNCCDYNYQSNKCNSNLVSDSSEGIINSQFPNNQDTPEEGANNDSTSTNDLKESYNQDTHEEGANNDSTSTNDLKESNNQDTPEEEANNDSPSTNDSKGSSSKVSSGLIIGIIGGVIILL